MDLAYIARAAARSENLRFARTRVMHPRGWTAVESDLVRMHFPNRKAACRALPKRTWCAIRSRATILGLRRPIARWLASELSTLKRLWCGGAPRQQLIEALSRFDYNQIKSQARKHKFHRPPRSLTSVQHPIINQIKARARELNMSMHDVDELAHTGNYFRSAAFLNSAYPQAKAVVAAVRALDGEVIARWKD